MYMKINSNNDFWSREVTPGEIGCSLSHYQCIKGAYAEGFTGILILEEDFIPKGTFPTVEMLDSIPKDASIVYLDRNKVLPSFKEEKINEHLTRASYSYNTHAYLVTRKGMKEIISSNFLDNIIPLDEYYSAVNGISDRADAIAKLHIKGFKSYAFGGGFFSQASNRHTHSLTEFPPEVLNAKTGSTGSKTFYKKTDDTNILKLENIVKQPKKLGNIQDANDFEAWSKKYIHPMVRSQEKAWSFF